MGSNKRPKILMLKGLPASGKTTHARELVDKGYVRVNKDDLRSMMDNGKWSKGNEERVLRLRDQIIRVAVNSGSNVVVDDTNFEDRHRERIAALAEEDGADLEVLFIDTPLEECISRNEKRANKVPVSVIVAMHNKYIAPLRNTLVEQDREKDECIIVDVDGTLAHIDDKNPRSPYDGSRAHEDLLDDAVANVAGMAYQNGYKVIILTGRSAEHLEVTKTWLEANGVNYDEIYVRADGDKRKDTVVKEELFRAHVLPRFYTKYVIDDRPSVCRMWRSLGLKTLQVGDPHNEF